MIKAYEQFHGAVLHELISTVAGPLTIEALKSEGRVNSFLVNKSLGLQIKHCSKRIAPWLFNFTDGSDSDLKLLLQKTKKVWFALVCGQDGVLLISYDEYQALTSKTSTRSRYVRVDRDRGTMYHVTGNVGQLKSAKPRGVSPFTALLDQPSKRKSLAIRPTLRESDRVEHKAQ
jgi:hypothetical protein